MLNGLSRTLLRTVALFAISFTALAQQWPSATPVVTAPAELRVMAPVNWSAATVTSIDDAQLAAEVSGRLLELADEGVSVRQGQPLGRVDDFLIRADLLEAKAIVDKEQANLTFLEREVERLQRLAKQNNAAQTQLEQTLAERDATLSELAAAKARLQIAEERLARTVLKAPFDGVVVMHEKQRGEWVDSGDVVMQFANPARLEIETMAPTRLKPYLIRGDSVTVKDDQLQRQAQIAAVVPVADSRSGLLRVRLSLKDNPWLAGQALRVALPTAAKQEVLAVPRDALVLRRSGSHLFKVNGEQKAERVQVQTGIAAGDYIQVSGALDAGERVVTRGNERLRPGMAVADKNSPPVDPAQAEAKP